MKRKNISFLLFLLGAITLTSCGNAPISSEETSSEETTDIEVDSSLLNLDLTNCRINLTDATSLGIDTVYHDVEQEEPDEEDNGNGPDVTIVWANKYHESNKIVKTTTSNSSNVEIEDNQIEVTFTKTDTTVIGKEIDGEDDHLSYGATYNKELNKYNDDAKVKLDARDGFTYSLYDGNTLIYYNVKDNDKLDKDVRNEVIVFDNLKADHVYTVKYHGYGEETIITQEEMDAEIDKMYVYNSEFTFISFVKKGMSRRYQMMSSGDDYYDRTHYYSDEWHKSYIINNKTGYIYPIDRFTISHLENGLIIQGKTIYDFYIDEDNNLVLNTISQNPEIDFVGAFKDKYGHKFVPTYSYEYYDAETDTTYFSYEAIRNDKNKYKYFLTSENETIKTEIVGGNYTSYGTYTRFKNPVILGKGNTERPINEDDNFTVYHTGLYFNKKIISKVVNGIMYCNNTGRSQECLMLRYDPKDDSFIGINSKKEFNTFFDCSYFDYGVVLEYIELFKEVRLIRNVWDVFDEVIKTLGVAKNTCYYLNDYFSDTVGFKNNKEVILSDVEREYNFTFKKVTPNGTYKYHFVPTYENGDIDFICLKEGEMLPRVSITLQPINR